MPALADDLARIPLFSGLNKRQLRKLAGGFKELGFAPGRAVVREGHVDGVGFFVIATGTAAVSVGGEAVATIGPGDYFGEMAMITTDATHGDRDRRDASPVPDDPVLGLPPGSIAGEPRRLVESIEWRRSRCRTDRRPSGSRCAFRSRRRREAAPARIASPSAPSVSLWRCARRRSRRSSPCCRR